MDLYKELPFKDLYKELPFKDLCKELPFKDLYKEIIIRDPKEVVFFFLGGGGGWVNVGFGEGLGDYGFAHSGVHGWHCRAPKNDFAVDS